MSNEIAVGDAMRMHLAAYSNRFHDAGRAKLIGNLKKGKAKIQTRKHAAMNQLPLRTNIEHPLR